MSQKEDQKVIDEVLNRLKQLSSFTHDATVDKNDAQFLNVINSHISLLATATEKLPGIILKSDDSDEIKKRDKQNEILLSLCKEIARSRGKEDLLHVISATIKNYINFDDSFILRYNKTTRTCRSYIFHSEESRSANPEYKKYLHLDYPVLDDSVDDSHYPIVYNVAALLPYGGDQITFMSDSGIKEFACVKLVEGNQLTGLFILLSENENSFNGDDLDLLQKISYQIAIATANIIANEEIALKEKEKSMLLAFSNAMASERDKVLLAKILKKQLKELFSIEDYVIHALSWDKKTFYPFLYDAGSSFAKKSGFLEMINSSTDINNGLFNKILESEGPLIFDTEDCFYIPGIPAFSDKIKDFEEKKIAGIRLRLGQDNIAFLNFRMESFKEFSVLQSLFNSICSQIAIIVSNIIANEKVNNQLIEINKYKQQLEDEKVYLKAEIETSHNYADIIGESAEMKNVFQLVTQVAHSNSTVLILGETGTGKELVARAIHNSSPRKNELMVKVNCATLPANLIESELFGHERGSFTGATDRRIGKFELANKGTLFLDEIGEMPPELQVKILRALQEKEIERIGGTDVIKIDVRIIAATNRDLDKLVEEGKFRSDLYYRLNIFPIMLPPLRSRKEDIPKLVLHFIGRFSKKSGRDINTLSNRAMRDLMEYDWPGNIRELEHLIERSVLLANDNIIKEVHLPSDINNLTNLTGTKTLKIKTLDENEEAYIIKVLRQVNGRIAGKGGAADLLGMPPSTLNSKIKRLGIIKEKYE